MIHLVDLSFFVQLVELKPTLVRLDFLHSAVESDSKSLHLPRFAENNLFFAFCSWSFNFVHECCWVAHQVSNRLLLLFQFLSGTFRLDNAKTLKLKLNLVLQFFLKLRLQLLKLLLTAVFDEKVERLFSLVQAQLQNYLCLEEFPQE